MSNSLPRAAGTGSSVVVDRCQVCDEKSLEHVLFLGYLPPVNQMRPIGSTPFEQPAYPARVLFCPHCKLVQLGLIVDPCILFPPEYPYTSGTTRILRENFADLYNEIQALMPLKTGDLVVDVGSNDGTLLSNFQRPGIRVHGIEPSDMGLLARSRGIDTTIGYFGKDTASSVLRDVGPARVITATNVFAHIENIHDVVENIVSMLRDDGIFVSESHYLISLLETLQYDTVYHEHLRYYSLTSLKALLEMHGLEVFHARRIPTHGGSIRVYAGRKGRYKISESVVAMLSHEGTNGTGPTDFDEFRRRVVLSKLKLYGLLTEIIQNGGRVCGISAPSRASTLISYTGLDDGILDCVLEIAGSHKIGKYMPGTLIPVEEESRLFADQPDHALILSWHIADELIPKLAQKGYKGGFIVPLPEPRIIRPAV
ncbi:MAG: class I SAM-dependent methyltransferase [Pseudomonadota bacterium]